MVAMQTPRSRYILGFAGLPTRTLRDIEVCGVIPPFRAASPHCAWFTDITVKFLTPKCLVSVDGICCVTFEQGDFGLVTPGL